MAVSHQECLFRPEDIRVMEIALDAVLAKLDLNGRVDEDAKDAASVIATK